MRAVVDVLERCFDGVSFLGGDKRRRAIDRVGGRVQVCPWLGPNLNSTNHLTTSPVHKWHCDEAKFSLHIYSLSHLFFKQ